MKEKEFINRIPSRNIPDRNIRRKLCNSDNVIDTDSIKKKNNRHL